MSSIRTWISAFRLRTLFLAVATVVLGSGIALHEGKFSLLVFVLTLVLSIFIQILANLANDLGDFEKGTDITGKRQGPVRAMQSGSITRKQIIKAILITVILSMALGSILILAIAKEIGHAFVFGLFIVGLFCILSALFYTMGKIAYGYKGWGDFFAFLFFGPVAVIGTYFLHVHRIDFQPMLPSIGMGFISAMILNINNMRDIDNDKESGKITVASKLGLKRAKLYHVSLTFGMFACFLQYSFMFAPLPWYRYLYTIVLFLFFIILSKITNKKNRELDPYLKFTSLSGFLLAVAFSLCIKF